MGRRPRSSSRILLRQKLPIRSTRIAKLERKQYNTSRGRGGARRVLKAKAKQSKMPVVETEVIDYRIQDELEKVIKTFDEEDVSNHSPSKENIPNGILNSKTNEVAIEVISKLQDKLNRIVNSESNIESSSSKQIPPVSEKMPLKEDTSKDSDKRLLALTAESPSNESKNRNEIPVLEVTNESVREKENIYSFQAGSMASNSRNDKVRRMMKYGNISIGQQKGHRYLNILSKRNRLNMYKLSMDKNPLLRRFTRSLSVSNSVNFKSSLSDTKFRSEKEFQPQFPKRISSPDAFIKNMAVNADFDSRPGTSKGCIQSSSSNDVSTLPTILRNSVIARNSDSEVDDEEEMVDSAKEKCNNVTKEVVDVIDGIAFVTFESEHEMVRFTRSTTEESPSKGDGTDPSLMIESLGAIIPRKTKDITKIKGWQRKKFSVSLNPMSEPIGQDISPEVNDDSSGNIVIEHNYIRRLSNDFENRTSEDTSLPNEAASDANHKIDLSTEEQDKSTLDSSKSGEWKQSTKSAFVSYHPETQTKSVERPPEKGGECLGKLASRNLSEILPKDKQHLVASKDSSVNGNIKMKIVAKGKELMKKNSLLVTRSVQVDMPRLECKRIPIKIGDVIKYPSYNWFSSLNNWEIDHERAVFAATALVLEYPKKKKRCKTVEKVKEKGECGYSLRKRLTTINRRRSLRSATDDAPVRITRALSNLLCPTNQSETESSPSTPSVRRKSFSPISTKTSSHDSMKCLVDSHSETSPKIKPSPKITETPTSSCVTHLSEEPFTKNSDDSKAEVPTISTSISPNPGGLENSHPMSPENVHDLKTSSLSLTPIAQVNSTVTDSQEKCEEFKEEKIKADCVKKNKPEIVKQRKSEESRSTDEIKSKSKMKSNNPEKDIETVEWEISHKSKLSLKELSQDQENEDIRVFLRPKPRFQGNQSVPIAVPQDTSMFISSTSDSSYAVSNNISPTKSGEIEVFKSRSPKSPALARKKLIRELSKLNANFVSVDERSELQDKVCTEEFCKLGCICESLRTEKRVTEHCGQMECMFSCVCPSKSNVSRLQVIGSDTVSRLQEESSRHMAKVEKAFHNTVVEAAGELVLPGRRQRERRVPKRFLDDESINPESLFFTKKAKPSCVKNNAENMANIKKNEAKTVNQVNAKECKISIQNMPLFNSNVRCLNHFAIDCVCINKVPRNIAVKSTTPRNIALLSKTPARIPDFSLGRSKDNIDESLKSSSSKIPNAGKALYIHHIQGDEVLSFELDENQKIVHEKVSKLNTPKTQGINCNVESILITSCARTVGIDLWTSRHPHIKKNKSIQDISLRNSIENESGDSLISPEEFPKSDGEKLGEINLVSQEEAAPMFKIVEVKSLSPGSFDSTMHTSKEDGDLPKQYFPSYENFYSWLYSSQTRCQDLRRICSNSLAPLPVNSVKLMKWKDLNNLLKSHSAHMWIRQRLGSSPRIYVTANDVQPDAACVNFLDLERKEELITQIALILKSAKDDLSCEHSCCILICRGAYWAVAGNINLEKYSENDRLLKVSASPKKEPRILIRKSNAVPPAPSSTKSCNNVEEALVGIKSTSGSGKTLVAERTSNNLNSELSSSPNISTEHSSAKVTCSSNQSEMLDPDQILLDIETSLPDILEGLVPSKNSDKPMDNLRYFSKHLSIFPIDESGNMCTKAATLERPTNKDAVKSEKSGKVFRTSDLSITKCQQGNSISASVSVSLKSSITKSNIQHKSPPASKLSKYSILKTRPENNKSPSMMTKNVEVAITHLSSKENGESRKVSSMETERFSIQEENTSKFIKVGPLTQSSPLNTKTILKSNIEPVKLQKSLEEKIKISTLNVDEISRNKSSPKAAEPNSKISTLNSSKEESIETAINSEKVSPVISDGIVGEHSSKIIASDKKGSTLEALNQALSDSSKVKVRTEPPPVLIIDLKQLRKGSNTKNEPVKIPVRVTNLKTLAQGLTEPKNIIDKVSERINITTKSLESKISTVKDNVTLSEESENTCKINTPKRDVLRRGMNDVGTIGTKFVSPNKNPKQSPGKMDGTPPLSAVKSKLMHDSCNKEKESSPVSIETDSSEISTSSASQSGEMTIASKNDSAVDHKQHSPEKQTESYQLENVEVTSSQLTSGSKDNTNESPSKLMEKSENLAATSPVETKEIESKHSTSKQTEESIIPPLTDDTALTLSSSVLEINEDKQNHAENDLIWYRLYLNHQFDRLLFMATSFSASKKRIVSAVQMARSSNRTVRLSFKKNANSYLEFRKGIYAVPTIEEMYVKIGPFGKNEPTGVVLLKKDGQIYKPCPDLLVMDGPDVTSTDVNSNTCMEKVAGNSDPSSSGENLNSHNETNELPSSGTKSEQITYKKSQPIEKSDGLELGSSNLSSLPNSGKENSTCKVTVMEKGRKMRKNDKHGKFSLDREPELFKQDKTVDQHALSSENVCLDQSKIGFGSTEVERSCKNKKIRRMKTKNSAKKTYGGSKAGKEFKKSNKNLEIWTIMPLSSNASDIPIQTKTVDSDLSKMNEAVTESFNNEVKNETNVDNDGVLDGEVNDKHESNKDVRSKGESQQFSDNDAALDGEINDKQESNKDIISKGEGGSFNIVGRQCNNNYGEVNDKHKSNKAVESKDEGGSLNINGQQCSNNDGILDGEVDDKLESNKDIGSKGEILNPPCQENYEPAANEDSGDLSIKIQCVEGNWQGFSDLPSCTIEDENAVVFEHSSDEIMADLDQSTGQPEERKTAVLDDGTSHYLSDELIQQLRIKKLIGPFSEEPMSLVKTLLLTPISKKKKKINRAAKVRKGVKFVKTAKVPGARRSKASANDSIPMNAVLGYLLPDIPNICPIRVTKTLMFTMDDPAQPKRKVELEDMETVNAYIDDVLRMRVKFFPIDLRIKWTFVRANESKLDGLIDIKDITKEMFITEKGVFNYSDFTILKEVKKLGFDQQELYRYFELKKKREVEQARFELASIFVPKNKAQVMSLTRSIQLALEELKSLKQTEENLSQINLIETKKKLQLEDKLKAHLKAQGMLQILKEPAAIPTFYRARRGRPPKRRYYRGRWRGYGNSRMTAPDGLQTPGTSNSFRGMSFKRSLGAGRPKRGRPLSRRNLTKADLSWTPSAEIEATPATEIEPTLAAEIEPTPAAEIEHTPVKSLPDASPGKRKVPPNNKILSASPDTVRNLLAIISAPGDKDKEVSDISDGNSVSEYHISSSKTIAQESNSEDAKKQGEGKTNTPVNALLWKKSFIKLKVSSDKPLVNPLTPLKFTESKDKMKKIIVGSHDNWLKKANIAPSALKNLSGWSTRPSSPPNGPVS